MKERLVFDVMTDENGFAAVPFCLVGQNDAVIILDWNDEDGKEERLTADNALGGNGCIHRYADAKTWHRIELDSPDWSKVYICGIFSSSSEAEKNLPMMSFASIAMRCRWRLKSPLPSLAGTAVMNVDGQIPPFEWTPEFRCGTMDYAFTLMKDIGEIPMDVFACRKWRSFRGTFSGCRFESSVPAGLFRGQDEAESFDACFARCSFFRENPVPSRLFSDCSKARSMKAVFGSSDIAFLPDELFYGCSSVKEYAFAFANTNIAILPQERMFQYSPDAEDFSGCFSGCTSLQIAPSGIFAGTKAKTVYRCFADCTSLDTIGCIFSGCSSIESFEACFIGCTKLNGVPSDLFGGNRDAVNFADCFAGCTRLIYVNAGLTADLGKAETMAGMFRSCRSIKNIPEGMFSGCSSVKTFAGVFSDCISLECVEDNVFRKCDSVLSFRSAFAKCSNLRRLPVNVFAWSPKARDFACCFDGCASLKDADIRIESGCVENAESFFTYNPSWESRGRKLAVHVPADTKTAKHFMGLAFGNDWSVMKFHG